MLGKTLYRHITYQPIRARWIGVRWVETGEFSITGSIQVWHLIPISIGWLFFCWLTANTILGSA